jgi:hypothetical protein
MPPGTAPTWDDNDWWAQASLIAYEQVREHEDMEWQAQLASPKRTRT